MSTLRPGMPAAPAEGVAAEDILWIRDEVERIADADEGAHASIQELAATCDELRSTLSRFLPAIRDLEVLADSGIGVQEHASRGPFDALELDAYSKTHELCRVLSAQASDLEGLRTQVAAASAELGHELGQRVARWRRLRSRVSGFARSSVASRVRRLDDALGADAVDGARGLRVVYAGPDTDCEIAWIGALETLLLELARLACRPGLQVELRVEADAVGATLRIAPRVLDPATPRAAALDVEPDPRLCAAAAAIGARIARGDAAGDGLAVHVNVLQAEIAVLVVRVSQQLLAFPMSRLKAVVRRCDVQAHGEDAVQVDGEFYRVRAPAALAGDAAPDGGYLALIDLDGPRLAVGFDAIEGSQRVRALPLSEPLPALSVASAAAILEDGRTVAVLDTGRMIDATRSPTASPAARPSQATSHEILVVDDSVTIRKVTERILLRNGYPVRLARDGREALDALRERTPALILLDIEMPRMNGFQLLEAMSGDPRLAAVPVVMISSRCGPKHREQAARLGVEHFLGKPFQELALLSVMEDILG